MINVVPVIVKEEKHRCKKTDKYSDDRRTVNDSEHFGKKLTSKVILTENCFNLIFAHIFRDNLIRRIKTNILIFWSYLGCILSDSLVTRS